MSQASYAKTNLHLPPPSATLETSRVRRSGYGPGWGASYNQSISFLSYSLSAGTPNQIVCLMYCQNLYGGGAMSHGHLSHCTSAHSRCTFANRRSVFDG